MKDIARLLRALADRLDPQPRRSWWLTSSTTTTNSAPVTYTIRGGA